MNMLSRLGVIRYDDLGDFTVTPHRIVRDTLFRLGFIATPYASDAPSLAAAPPSGGEHPDEHSAMDYDQMTAEVKRELSRMYRYFLNGGLEISVNGTSLLPHDPLMLMERSWSDHVLHKRLLEEWRKAKAAEQELAIEQLRGVVGQ